MSFSLMSRIKEINSLFIETPKKRKVVDIEKAVCVGGTIVARLRDGTLWSNAYADGYDLLPGNWKFHDEFLPALVTLGYLTKEQVVEYKRECEEHETRKRLRDDYEHLTMLQKKYGDDFKELFNAEAIKRVQIREAKRTESKADYGKDRPKAKTKNLAKG